MSADGGRRGSGAARGGGSVRAPVVSNEKRVNNCVDWSGPRAGGGFARDRPGSRAYQSLHKHRSTTACTRWAAPRTGRTSTEAPAYPAGWRARTSPGDVATPLPTARKTPRANLSPSTESRGAVSDVVRSRLSPFFHPSRAPTLAPRAIDRDAPSRFCRKRVRLDSWTQA